MLFLLAFSVVMRKVSNYDDCVPFLKGMNPTKKLLVKRKNESAAAVLTKELKRSLERDNIEFYFLSEKKSE